jgi:diguanylate cyclase (GGDEF)-like protein
MENRTKVVSGQLKVSDLMSQELVTVPLGTPLVQVAKLLDRRRSRHILVTDERGNLAGLVSDSDLVHYIADRDPDSDPMFDWKAVECVMATKFVTSSPDAKIEDVAAALGDGAVHCLPILEHGRLVGVMTDDDLLFSCSRLDHVLKQASLDVLTGLANRATFNRRLDEELDRATRQQIALALIVFDVDRFKNVNDSWGHATGDSVLRIVAACLRQHLRKYDVVARIGGDEFAAICTAAGPRDVAIPLHRLRLAVRSLGVSTHAGRRDISLSIGAALLGAGTRITPTQLTEIADRCMYRAKADGGDKLYLMQLGENPDSEPSLIETPDETELIPEPV